MKVAAELTTRDVPVRNSIREGFADRRNVVMLAVNLIGVALYLWGASHSWAIPEEHATGIHSRTSEPFIWALFVLPLWMVLFLADTVWVVSSVGRRKLLGLVPILAVAAVWIGAVVVDFAHH